MSRISEYNRGVLFEMRDELVYVEPYGPDCVRVRATRNARLSEEKWTLLDAEACESTVCMESEEKARLINGKLMVEVSKVHPWHKCCILTFYRDGKQVLRTREESDPASRYTHVEGDHYRTRVIFEAREDEHIYGLGQEQQDYFNRKGCTYDLMHWNTKGATASSGTIPRSERLILPGIIRFGRRTAVIRRITLYLSVIRPRSWSTNTHALRASARKCRIGRRASGSVA